MACHNVSIRIILTIMRLKTCQYVLDRTLSQNVSIRIGLTILCATIWYEKVSPKRIVYEMFFCITFPIRHEMGRTIRVDGAMFFPPYQAISYRFYNITSNFSVKANRGDTMNPKHAHNTYWIAQCSGIVMLISIHTLNGLYCPERVLMLHHVHVRLRESSQFV